MKSAWKQVTLGEVCGIPSKLVDPRLSDFHDLLHVGAGNMETGSGELKGLLTAREEGLISGKFLFDEKVVLYSKIRPYLMKVARPDFAGLCSADVYPLEPSLERVNRDFLYHLLLTPDFTDYAVEGSARAGMPKVNRDHLFAFKFLLPSLPEQQRIVAILDEAFDGIATAKANSEKNLQNAREFVENYLESNFSFMSLGDTKRPLGDIATFRNGINFTKQSQGKSVRIVGVKDFQKNYWAPMEDLDSVTIDGSLSALDTVNPGDILSVRSNGNPFLIGRCLLIPEHEGPVTYSGFTIRIRLNTDEVVPRFLCHFLKSQTARQELVAGGNGANIKSLNQGTLAAIRVPIPPVHKQQEVVQLIETMTEEAVRLEDVYRQKLSALDELKQSLLHQAFTGHL